MTRQEHIDLSKRGALEYVERGNLIGGLMSLVGSLKEHEETMHHAGIGIGLHLSAIGELDTPEKMREFINDFLL